MTVNKEESRGQREAAEERRRVGRLVEEEAQKKAEIMGQNAKSHERRRKFAGESQGQTKRGAEGASEELPSLAGRAHGARRVSCRIVNIRVVERREEEVE